MIYLSICRVADYSNEYLLSHTNVATHTIFGVYKTEGVISLKLVQTQYYIIFSVTIVDSFSAVHSKYHVCCNMAFITSKTNVLELFETF